MFERNPNEVQTKERQTHHFADEANVYILLSLRSIISVGENEMENTEYNNNIIIIIEFGKELTYL